MLSLGCPAPSSFHSTPKYPLLHSIPNCTVSHRPIASPGLFPHFTSRSLLPLTGFAQPGPSSSLTSPQPNTLGASQVTKQREFQNSESAGP